MLLAIEYMHNLDMCHRDLKPDNIFVEKSDTGIHVLKISPGARSFSLATVGRIVNELTDQAKTAMMTMCSFL
jgi:serine/threonine protein kinase